MILLCLCLLVGAVLLAGAQHAAVKHAAGARIALAAQSASHERLESTHGTCATASRCSRGCWLPIADSPARPRGVTGECAASKQKPCMLLIAAGSQRQPSASAGFCNQPQGIRAFRNLKPARPKAAPKAPKSHR